MNKPPDTFEKLLLEMDGDNVRAEIIFYLQSINRAEQQKTKARQRLIHALMDSSGKVIKNKID